MEFLKSFKGTVAGAVSKATDAIHEVSVKNTMSEMKEATLAAAERATDRTKAVCTEARENLSEAYENAATEIRKFDYAKLGDANFYANTFETYKDLSVEKVQDFFRSTLEVDKTTMEMVNDVRRRLPVPAQTVDEIFKQCRREAIQRAIASFALAGVVQDIDRHSEAKYANLSETYTEFMERSGSAMTDEPAFAAMKTSRQQTPYLQTLENGYNKNDPLFPADADIEHVLAKKEYYRDRLIRIGTTDEEFYSAINSEGNLVFADASLNRSMQDRNIYEYLAERGRPDQTDPDLVHVDIPQKDGSTRTVTVSRKDVDEAYERADSVRNAHRLAAAKEVGMTALKTGTAMAAQQVVGLIVIETIDIFVDEIRDFAVNDRTVPGEGWFQNASETSARIRQRLETRFEERQIWARAKSLGIEAGVSGALSVIPQILLSTLAKMPVFVLSIIRESTLSTIRCVRILTSDDDAKLESIKIILAGSAAAIVGAYVSRAISTGIAAVPLLNHFNAAVANVISGLLVTAVPLTAILIFERNKQRFSFLSSHCSDAMALPAATKPAEPF